MYVFQELINPITEQLVIEKCCEENIELETVCEEIRQARESLISMYYRSQEGEIDYSNFYTRVAYLNCFVPGFSVGLEETLKYIFFMAENDVIEVLGYPEEFNSIVFGGGPGTELIALSSTSKNARINFTLTDKEQLWFDLWYKISNAIKEIDDSNIINCNFIAVDLRSPNQADIIKSASGNANIVFMNYVISELYGYRSLLKEFAKNAYDWLPSKSILIFVDRNQSNIRRTIDEFSSEFDCNIILPLMDFQFRCTEDFSSELTKMIGQPKGSYFKGIRLVAQKK